MKTQHRETPQAEHAWPTPGPDEELPEVYRSLLEHIDDELDAQIQRDLVLIARRDARSARWRRLLRLGK